MFIIQLIFRWLLRLKWWFFLLPLSLTALAIWLTRNMEKNFQTDLTIYTGVISSYGSDPGQSNAMQDWNVLNNNINNIINTIQSKETLRVLSLNLFARIMINGNLNKDNNYITAEHFRHLYAITPEPVKRLIVKDSEEQTVQNLLEYEQPDKKNFVYGLINWDHPYFSYSGLKSRIKIIRVDNSDILRVSYEANDPGIAYQTLDILGAVFAEEYKTIQFSNTNNVIKYFERELVRVGRELRGLEDSLTDFNVANRIINYDKQTEAVAFLEKEFTMRSSEVVFVYNNSQAALKHLESGLDANVRAIKNNTEFLSRLDNISHLNYNISKIKTGVDTLLNVSELEGLNDELQRSEKDLKSFLNLYTAQKYTRDGYPNANYVTQWVDELLKFKKAEAEMQVVFDFNSNLDKKYSHFSPIGSILKRKERTINFIEQSYLSILSSLNAARLRLKSLEMNSAVLKVINPPTYPLISQPTKRRVIVGGVFFGAIVLLLGVFLFMELLDRTLRDKLRTERLTRTKVISAFPKKSIRDKDKNIEQRLIHTLANNLYSYYRPEEKLKLINIVSPNAVVDEQKITEKLQEFWRSRGVFVEAYYEGKDFHRDSREYLIDDDWVNHWQKNDLNIVHHGALSISPIPTVFLKESFVTVVLLEADNVFTSEEEMMLNALHDRMGEKPVLVCLMNAKKYVVEEFTGLLPPYTFYRRLEYRLSNLGLTSR